MQCLRCGGEMLLMSTIEDETMSVSGFERHAYMCSVCFDTENRLAFNKHAPKADAQTIPIIVSPPVAPGATHDKPVSSPYDRLAPTLVPYDHGAATHSFFGRLFTKVTRSLRTPFRE
jgi:hypothetical protein